ncbi:FAD-linked oxidoreductase apf9 [Colletotrichum spaethianum]|uniref:FAD-linked oxidoreductase apf9 n=1 Tax=Colletotrichum spaethianum TaxID=700344 RepID=A0AA37NZW1_9PEZI|nr:FAD-linked oxidoreductase apf9 [Colletotrichum spaethianum]GKT42698.1 FAD-linked oxidoreductase apf9 [Colletotrichum spaethianum]
MKWAASRNVRVIVKGTGHDLNGRSSGACSLSIWTHQFRQIKLNAEWLPPLRNNTENVAILRSGINWGNALEAAAKVGRTLVSGQVSTVCLRGFIGGGGHGPHSSHYGLAADQVLQATVVTTSGHILVVNEAQNQDLLWAIRGGGPGSYGVVTEYVLRTHPIPRNVVQAVLSMSMAGNDAEAAVSASWSAMAILTSYLPDLMVAGIAGFGNAVTTKASKLPSGAISQGIETSFTFFGYNTTATTLSSAIEPLKERMIASGKNNTMSIFISEPTVFPTYLSFFDDLNKSPQTVEQISLISSRLLGRKELTEITLEALRFHLQSISKSQIEGNPSSLIFGLQDGPGPAQVQPDMRGAVNPGWRSA